MAVACFLLVILPLNEVKGKDPDELAPASTLHAFLPQISAFASSPPLPFRREQGASAPGLVLAVVPEIGPGFSLGNPIPPAEETGFSPRDMPVPVFRLSS